MSIKTWKIEFYPTPASAAAHSGDLAATLHSLTKWEGLRHENLAKHNVIHGTGIGRAIHDTCEPFYVDSSTCALCHLYEEDDVCTGCPLAETLGRRCDAGSADLGGLSEYTAFTRANNPEPMIAALKRAVGRLENM